MKDQNICNCSHFQTQIVNATEGSYNTSFTWCCPVHGTMHKDFETPEGFAPSKHERGQAIKHHLNRLSNNTYTCEHGVVQKIGTHSHAPVMDMTEKKCEHGNESWDCSKCIRKVLTRPTTDTSDWRERFDDHFFVHPNGVFRNGKILHPEYFPLTIETVKAFIAKEIEKAWEESFVRGNQSTSEGNQLYFEAGLKKGREEGKPWLVQQIHNNALEEGRTAATEEFQSKIWKNDEAHKMGRNSAFAEVKELLKDALTLEPRDGDTWKRGYYDAVIFMIELTDKQV